jgi:hypothetical protein
VAEMDPGLQELSHADDCQNCLLAVVFGTAGGAGWNRCNSGTAIHRPAGTGFRAQKSSFCLATL